MIPKKIHYCWLSGDPFPEDIKRYMASWKEHLPDYEFILWDTNRFDLNSSVWCKQAFEAKKYAFAADYIRLYAVYHEGGIYLDSDIEVLRSFNDALDRDIMMAYEQSDESFIEAGCFGAVKHHPFIKDCMEYYHGREFIQPDGSYDLRTLPTIMTSIILEKYSFDCIVQLPPTVLTSKSYKNGVIKTDSSNYVIHHFKGHWLERDFWAIRKLQWYIHKILGENALSHSVSKEIDCIYGMTKRLYIRYKDKGTVSTYNHYKNVISYQTKIRFSKKKYDT